MKQRLTYAQINLSNYRYNFQLVRILLGKNVKMMAVVKANAYGHGAVAIAREAEKLKADYIGVVCLFEAKELREAGVKLPILILNYTDSDSLEFCLTNDITLNIMDETLLKTLDSIARKNHKKAKIHVKIDSGMHRLGLLPQDALKFIPKIENYKNISLEGIFTHFATSDETDLSFTVTQLQVFQNILKKLNGKGIHPPLIHAANSAATLRMKSTHFQMVRPGIILYGLAPSPDFKLPFEPKPVLSLKSVLVQIRRIGKGETVGYGRTFTAEKETVAGVFPMGYADGLRRAPQNWGEVLISGQRVPILGRVSMDQTSIDLTGIENVTEGEEIVLIGSQGNEKITAEEVATKVGTINYEIVSSLSKRVEREYIFRS